MGATQEANATMSPILAAGMDPIITVAEPWLTTPGPPGTQLGSMQGEVPLDTTAADIPAMLTVGTQPLTRVTGMGGCGKGVGVGNAG